MASATLRPATTGWRSGFDHQQHWPADAHTAVCGEPIREGRYDRPDWPRDLDCIELAGITVARPPSADQQTWTDEWAPGELTEAFGR